MLVGADGGKPRLLPRLTADDEQPTFLPSGAALVFVGRTSPNAKANLYTVNTDGSDLRKLTSAGGSQPAPCTDGAIVYVNRDKLYLRERHGSSRLLTRIEATAPSCAPNSRTIAFIHAGELYVIARDGRRQRLLTRASRYGAGPGEGYGSGAYADTFSPDGKQIAMLVGYDVLSQNGSEEALVDVDLRGHRTARKLVVADSSFSGDSGQTDTETVAGFAWRPLQGTVPARPRRP
jgi:Tol biopolymer transport system component